MYIIDKECIKFMLVDEFINDNWRRLSLEDYAWLVELLAAIKDRIED